MGKVSKSYGGAIVFLAGASFVCGVGVSVIAWLLNSKTPHSILEKDLTSTTVVSFKSYWWGGIGFVIPGFMGIAAGVSRNSAVMILYMIFNILCLIAAGAMNVMVIMVLVVWLQIDSSVANDWAAGCTTLLNTCTCADLNSAKAWIMTGITCEQLEGIKGLLLGLVALGTTNNSHCTTTIPKCWQKCICSTEFQLWLSSTAVVPTRILPATDSK